MMTKTIIVSRRCDVQMAKKKRLFPCDRRCKQCVACIERDYYGNESHALRGGHGQLDYKLLFRNMRLRELYDNDIN